MDLRRAVIGIVLGGLGVATAASGVGPNGVVVRSALGGFILGYDVDATGTLGILSEAVTLPDGRHDVAVETFDQRSGETAAVLAMQRDSRNSFSTLGIFNTGVGLTEFEHVKKLYVDRRQYGVTSPLNSARFTGTWTPPFSGAQDIIAAAAPSQGMDETVFLAFHNNATDFHSYLFTSNVGANTFGPVIRVDAGVFSWSLSPQVAIDPARHRAVLAGSQGCFGCGTSIGFVDLVTGAQSTRAGMGVGSVNGMALDPNTGVACTTTEDDFSVEFYDFPRGIFKIFRLPNATDQIYSGGAVAVDPVHRLFLVGQEYSSTSPGTSSIHVYDEDGNYLESLDGFSLPASPAAMVLHPADRTGFVIVTPDLTSLQGFTY